MRNTTTARRLMVVPEPARRTGPTIMFCSHCGARPEGDDRQFLSRVCERCTLGLLLECAESAAPPDSGAFMVVDAALSVCAVSRQAEVLLAMREIEAVNRHLTELVVPADAEERQAQSLAAAVTWAARGDSATHQTFVRPANTFGVRLSARIAACGPPKAALLVFD